MGGNRHDGASWSIIKRAARLGVLGRAVRRLRRRSATMMDHPFHLHGFFFQVLDVNGKKPAWRSLEDVINVPPKGTVRIAWYPDDRPGMWMYHCHILEHHAAGMMAHFEVVR
jgi:FtsP/CotA-like multicopper oxidase with cupredoxin domain